jgi:hypothetical protein
MVMMLLPYARATRCCVSEAWAATAARQLGQAKAVFCKRRKAAKANQARIPGL